MKKRRFCLYFILVLSIVYSLSFSSYVMAKNLIISINFLNKSTYSVEIFFELENNVKVKYMLVKIPKDSRLLDCKYFINNIYKKECKIINNSIFIEINDEIRSLKVKYKVFIKSIWIFTDTYSLSFSFPYIDFVKQKKVIIYDEKNVIKDVKVEECSEVLKKGKKFEGVLCNYNPNVNIEIKYSMINFFGKKLTVSQSLTLLSFLIGLAIIFIIDYILYLKSCDGEI